MTWDELALEAERRRAAITQCGPIWYWAVETAMLNGRLATRLKLTFENWQTTHLTREQAVALRDWLCELLPGEARPGYVCKSCHIALGNLNGYTAAGERVEVCPKCGGKP